MTIKTELLAAVGAVLLLTSCGGGDSNDSREQQMEAMAKKHGVDADVSLDEKGEVKSVTINTANGTQVGKNLQLPDGFPADVPMAPDWDIMSVSPTPGGFMVQAMTDASANEVLAAARTQLTAQGWTETGLQQSSPVMTQVGFAKEDRMTNLNLMDAGDMRTVQLVTMTRPQ